MTPFSRLQKWYLSQCDGDWEHSFGVSITTLDNPGWTATMNLEGTNLEERSFEKVFIQRADANDWLHISKLGTKFQVACGPENLEEGLTIFCDWAESML